MTEEIKDNITSVESTNVETPQQEALKQDIVTPVEPTAQASPRPEESWRYLREDRERLERQLEQERREKEELLRYAREMQAQKQVPEDDGPIAAPDEYLEGKHLSKYEQKMQLKLERERKAREEYEARMTDMVIENRLMQEHPDFRKLLADENLKLLRERKPDLVKSIISNPDKYSMYKATIEAVKDFVLPSKQKEDESRINAERIAANLKKPIPSTSGTGNASSSALSKANAFTGNVLTEERKGEIYADYVRSQGGGAYYNFKSKK
jgi:hypothetical protein